MTESVETRMLKLSAKKYGTTFESDSDEDSGNSSGDDGKKDDGNDADDEDADDDRKVAASPATSSAQKKKKAKTPHKDAPGEVATGALRQDKAQMAADEFDLLFGIGDAGDAPPAAAAAAAAPAAANADADLDDDDLGGMGI